MTNVKVKCINGYTEPKSLTEGKIYYGLLNGGCDNRDQYIRIAKDDLGQKGYNYMLDRFEIVEEEKQKIEESNWDFGLED